MKGRSAAVASLVAALAISSSASAEPADPKVTEAWAYDLDPGIDGRSLAFSQDGSHVAYRAKREGGWAVVVDGKETATHEDVAGLVVSPDGSRVAHWGKKDGTWHLVDGRKSRPVKGIPHYLDETTLVFGPGGRHVAGRTTDGPDIWFHVDDAAVGPFRHPATIRFSRDGERWGFSTTRGEKAVLVVDGKEIEHGYVGKGAQVGSPAFASGRRLVHPASRGTQAFVVVDGKVEGPYRTFRGSVLVAGDRVAYTVLREDETWAAVVDGKAGPSFETVADLVLSEDGKRFAYAARVSFRKSDDQTWVVVVDGKPGPEILGVRANSLGFSPDGSRLRYVLRKAKGWAVVVDGVEGETFDAILGDFAFSPEGKRFAHAGRRGKKWHLVVDGKPGAAAHDEIAAIRFSPDGALVMAQVATGGKPSLLVGDREIAGLGDAILLPAFDGPRTLRAVTVTAIPSGKGARMRLVRIEVPSGP